MKPIIRLSDSFISVYIQGQYFAYAKKKLGAHHLGHRNRWRHSRPVLRVPVKDSPTQKGFNIGCQPALKSIFLKSWCRDMMRIDRRFIMAGLIDEVKIKLWRLWFDSRVTTCLCGSRPRLMIGGDMHVDD